MTTLAKSFFPAWLSKPASQGNQIVISTRIRLARNFADLKFPPAASAEERGKVLKRAENFAKNTEQPKLIFQRMQDLDAVHRGILAERGLINMEYVSEPASTGLAIGPGQVVSMLINEEDHLRLQVMMEGLNLDASMKSARELDERLNRAFTLATHPQFGFLTSCPTNVGTGLRASVMLHLPALVLTRGIVQVLQVVLHIGLAVRGFSGEGTELRSVFFQVSNQMTLGRTEEEIVQHLSGITRQLIDREEEARQKLLKENRRLLEDKVGRSLGLLAGCKLLGFEEALDLLSAVRLGVETGVVDNIPRSVLNELLLLVQPAHIQLLAGKTLTNEAQMIRRAEIFQRLLKLKPRKG